MKLILSFLKPYKLQVIFAYFFTFMELIAELLFPLFLGIMINEGVMLEQNDRLFFWGSIMFGTTIIAFIAGILNSYFSAHISTTVGYDIREELFSKIQQFSFDVLSLYPTSMLVTRFTNDVRQIQNTLFMALRIMTKAPLLVIGSVIMAFVVNYKISLVFLVTVPVLLIFLYWVLQKGSKMFTSVQEKVDTVNRVIQENIAGMRIIKAFVRRDYESRRFQDSNEALSKETQTAFRFVEASMPILLLVMNLSLLFIIWFGNKQAIAGTTSVGDVVAIVNYALRTVMTISMFTFIALAFSRAKASGNRIEQLLTEKTTSITDTNNQTEMLTKGNITLDHVSFSYPNSNIKALSDISFTVGHQETLAIIGATGSGKTSLFQLIPRLYEVNSGNIYINDTNIQSLSLKQLRTSIGYVAQHATLFSGTIADNIRFGKENASLEEVVAAAKAAQIHETISSFPQQYDSIVGQKGVNLSGGQKQRISIARAFVRQPKILMLDDSTSALDVATEAKLLHEIAKFDCSTFLITQKIKTAQQADRILLLDAGNMLAIGTHEELMETSLLYQDIIQSQMEKEIAYVDQ